MKPILRLISMAVLITIINCFSGSLVAQPCSTAGTATASDSVICSGAGTELILTGFTGAIQWQNFDGSIWVNEIGLGSTTANYAITPAQTTDYRAVVTAVGCDPDTSNQITVGVGINAPVVTNGTRCGYGPVQLSAIGNGIKWYDASTGGNQLGTGTSFSPVVSTTTTFYAASSLGGGPPSPFTTTFAGGNGFDGNMFDITAINAVTIDSFAANFNPGTGTAEIWYRPGSYVGFENSNVGWIQAGTAPYTSTGNGAPGTSINVFVNVSIPAGQTYAFYVHGSAGIAYTDGIAVGNIFLQDANIEFKEGAGGAYFGVTNSPRIFNGRIMYSAGCESSRTAAIATVTTAPSFSINASPPALCQGQSSVISLTSTNSNYTYTWSPATGLSGTTGTSVTANPLSPITYTIIADDGTCGFIDSVFISVGPASVAGTAVISTDTICSGDPATLFLSGSTGNIQWQSFNGTSWVNESGPGSTTAQYVVSPPSNSSYRAVITSGGCDPDTTISLDLAVLTIIDPVTSGDSICGPGIVNLNATGAGLMNWYTVPTGGSSVFTGNNYSPSISNTTTYYVEAAAGSTYLLGLPVLQTLSQFTLGGNDWGIQFDVTAQSTIQSVNIYPGPVSGNITINLRSLLGGPILNTVTVPVTASSGPVTVNLGFLVNPGTGYRLELATGSVVCFYNSFGATYPFTSPGSPVNLTGQINPNFSAGTFYYYFYNWIVKEGCASNRVPVDGVVLPGPPVPTIIPQWNILTSSAASGNQWYLNGVLIPGANGQVYIATQAGNYTVVVTDANGCTAESLPSFTTSLSDAPNAAAFVVYPNPVGNKLYFELSQPIQKSGVLKVFNIIGKLIYSQKIDEATNFIEFNFAAGNYNIEVVADDVIYRSKVVKLN